MFILLEQLFVVVANKTSGEAFILSAVWLKVIYLYKYTMFWLLTWIYHCCHEWPMQEYSRRSSNIFHLLRTDDKQRWQFWLSSFCVHFFHLFFCSVCFFFCHYRFDSAMHFVLLLLRSQVQALHNHLDQCFMVNMP